MKIELLLLISGRDNCVVSRSRSMSPSLCGARAHMRVHTSHFPTVGVFSSLCQARAYFQCDLFFPEIMQFHVNIGSKKIRCTLVNL